MYARQKKNHMKETRTDSGNEVFFKKSIVTSPHIITDIVRILCK